MKVVLKFCLLIFLLVDMHLCLNFTADSKTEKGNPTNIVCSIDPSNFNTFISLLKDGSSKTSCDSANLCNPQNSDSGRYQYSSNSSSVTVKISNLTHLNDAGSWECRLGTTESAKYELVVKTIPMSTEFTQTIPNSNSSELVQNVKLSGRCYCIFPPPSEVELYFREGAGPGSFQFLERIPDSSVNKRNETSLCEPYEFDVEVLSFPVKMNGKTNVFFEMRFGDYKTSGVVGPFSFKAGCKYSDVELFLGGFSCFLIVLITSIIMLIFLFCNKRFGDKKTIKIIIIMIVVFNLVALMIGLGLGLGLNECNQRDDSLGLGLGLGFFLAIAQVLTLYLFHKQCGSKKENEDENRKPENNPQRVGLKS